MTAQLGMTKQTRRLRFTLVRKNSATEDTENTEKERYKDLACKSRVVLSGFGHRLLETLCDPGTRWLRAAQIRVVASGDQNS